jgi:hypothetical protein
MLHLVRQCTSKILNLLPSGSNSGLHLQSGRISHLSYLCVYMLVVYFCCYYHLKLICFDFKVSYSLSFSDDFFSDDSVSLMSACVYICCIYLA